MKCKEVKTNLIPYLYEETSKECTNRIEKHLATCPKCQKEMENLIKVRELCAQWPEIPIDRKFLQNTLLKAKPEILTLEELALYLRVTPEEIMIDLKNIPHLRIGKSVRFRRETIKKWLEEIEHWPLKREKELFVSWQIHRNRINNILM